MKPPLGREVGQETEKFVVGDQCIYEDPKNCGNRATQKTSKPETKRCLSGWKRPRPFTEQKL